MESAEKNEKKDLQAYENIHFKIHIVIGFLLLLLAFFGVIQTSWQSRYTHDYWLGLSIIYAISSIFLSWFTIRQQPSFTFALIWREVLHWLGLILAIYAVEIFRNWGFYSTPVASINDLLLLALASFLAGIHFDSVFILIGLFLGLIALLSVMMFEYLSFILLPVLILFGAIMWWQLRRKYKK